jgi:predicted RNase H-like HicB family nuclease
MLIPRIIHISNARIDLPDKNSRLFPTPDELDETFMAMAGCVNLKVKLPKPSRLAGIEGRRPMNTEYSAVTKQDGDWWIGWIVEVPGVNCQERTHEELLDSLRITLQEELEFNRKEAMKLSPKICKDLGVRPVK